MRKSKLRRNVALILFTISLILASTIKSQAAQVARVIVDQAQVYEFPDASAKALSTLGKDQSIAVSNIPTEGFYKVRLQTGELGWISGNDVLVGKAAAAEVKSRAEEPLSPETAAAVEEPKVRRGARSPKETAYDEDEPPSKNDRSRMALFGGLQYPNFGGLKTYYVTQGLSPGLGFGGEMQFQINSSIYWAARVEYLTSSSGVVDISSTTTQTIKTKSIPLMVGFHWSILNGGFRLGVGVYGGLAFSSSISIVQKTSSVENTIEYGSTDPAGYASLQMSIPLSKKFGLFTEAGYRYQKSGNFEATSAVPAFSADYSGPAFRVGIEMRF